MNVMTCREMEALLRDISLESGTIPPDAAAHLASCPRCSAQLERERRLTASLAALAGSLEPCEVPAAMEARLLAAFREHARGGRDRHTVFQLPARGPAVWAAGAAAIIVVSLGVALGVVLMGRQPSEALVERSVAPTASLENPQPADPAPIPGALRPGVPQPNPPAAEAAGRSADAQRSADPRPSDRPASVSLLEGDQTAPQRPPQAASEFVPLFYGGDPFLMEAGQVWRVEMPRGALQSVGMPIAEESRAGRIQVDILLGEDGIARAIRLVQ